MKKYIISIKKKIAIFLIISFVVSIFITIISQDKNLWSIVFGEFARIPYQWPAFSDFGSLSNAIKSLKEGHDPYLYNPHDIHKVPYVYTRIWLIIFDFFRLNDPLFFLIICFLIIIIYFLILLNFLNAFKNKYSYIALFLFFISPSNSLLVERLNTDIIIFILTYFLAINKNFIIKNILFIFSVCLKVYPIFAILIFLKNKKFFYTIIATIILIYIIYDQIVMGNKNMIEYALIFAYGARTFANALLRVLGNYNFILDTNSYELLKILLIAILAIASLLIFFMGTKKIITYSENLSDFFIIGSSIYLGTFIFTSNVDYRLIFLIYTFPLIFNDFNKWQAKLFFFSCFISFYSLWFHSGDYKSVSFALKGIFIYSLKFYIFLYLAYKLGSVLSSYKIIKRTNNYIFLGYNFLKVFRSKNRQNMPIKSPQKNKK